MLDSGGPDAVLAQARRLGDPGLATRILEAAGHDAAGITDRWRSETPITPQVNSNPSLFTRNPEHSPEAMEALQSGGIPAWNAKVKEITAARDAERAERAAARRALWIDAKTGQPVLEDLAPRPLVPQSSRRMPCDRNWEEWHSMSTAVGVIWLSRRRWLCDRNLPGRGGQVSHE